LVVVLVVETLQLTVETVVQVVALRDQPQVQEQLGRVITAVQVLVGQVQAARAAVVKTQQVQAQVVNLAVTAVHLILGLTVLHTLAVVAVVVTMAQVLVRVVVQPLVMAQTDKVLEVQHLQTQDLRVEVVVNLVAAAVAAVVAVQALLLSVIQVLKGVLVEQLVQRADLHITHLQVTGHLRLNYGSFCKT
jgi:hypothetical protein